MMQIMDAAKAANAHGFISKRAGAYDTRLGEQGSGLSGGERQRVAVWPYSGPVLIREQHPAVEGMTGFVVDNWCLVARLREFEDGTVEAVPEVQHFDLDRYKIIHHFLENPRNRRQVVLVPPAQMAAWAGAASLF